MFKFSVCWKRKSFFSRGGGGGVVLHGYTIGIIKKNSTSGAQKVGLYITCLFDLDTMTAFPPYLFNFR